MRLETYIKLTQIRNGKVRLIDFEGKELLSKVSNSDISIDFKLLFKNRIL